MSLQQHSAVLSAVSLLLLAACSGGGDSSTSSPAASTPTPGGSAGVAVASSDAPPPAVTTSAVNAGDLTAYAQVVVGVLKITTVSNSGDELVLFNSQLPVRQDVASLSSLRDFISKLPAASKVSGPVKVTLADEVRLLTRDGKTIDARLRGDGVPAVITLSGNVAEQPGNLLLALNLSQYSYDAVTGRVLPLSEKMNLNAMRNAMAAAQAHMPEPQSSAP